MKTITRSITLYNFRELSPKAQDTAFYEHYNSDGFSWSRDYLKSLEKLAEHFNGKLTGWNINWLDNSPSLAEFEMPEMEPDEIDRLLGELGTFNPETLQGHGDCKLTGFCADECAIDGFRKARASGETDLERLMQSAFREWLKEAHADASDRESFADTCDANEWLFTAQGNLETE